MKGRRLVSLPNLRQAARRDPEEILPRERIELKPNAFLVSWGREKLFCIRTYGCQGNVRDSEILRLFLLNMGMKETEEFSCADLIIFNTCAIRENAENHLYGELGRAKPESKRGCMISICGCMVQQEKAVKEITKTFPFVSLIFGTNNLFNFYSLLEEAIKGPLVDVRPRASIIEEYDEVSDTRGRFSSVSAFVDIMYGCDKFCTYCIVPYTRGKERSRRMEDIVSEVRMLKEKGYKQVTLLGQNVDSYGKDFKDSYAFAELLRRVAETGIERIRFTTPYPSDFNSEVFDVMARYDNIMPSLHLPLQSGSNTVLRRMNRRYTREEYLDIVHLLRERLPDVHLTTDIIVGFPNETEQDFEETLSICDECKYDGAFTFIFSPREGTPASRMKDEVTDETKKKRFMRLKEKIDLLTKESSDRMVGTTQEVLFETVSKRDETMISGYDRHNKLVHVKGDESLIGTIRKVRIKESRAFSLIGEIDE